MSFEIMRSELDLFRKIQFQGSIDNSQIVEYRPTSAIAGTSTIEFEIPTSADEYLDLQNIYLQVTGKLKSAGNVDFPAPNDNQYSMVNYGLNSIFDQLSVYLGGTLVSQSSKTYHYLAQIEALTQSDINTIDTTLVPAGFISSFKRQNYNPEAILNELSTISLRSRSFKLYGKLHGAIFNTDRLLLNGISLHIALTRAPNEFCLMGTAAVVGNAQAVPPVVAAPAVHPILDLTNMSLFVRKVKLTPNLMNAHALALQKTKAIYPIKRSIVKVHNLPANQSTFVVDNVFMGQLPCKIIFGLVSNTAFGGNYYQNPFNFNHNDLNFVALHINGEMYPKTPYTPDFRDDFNDYRREYHDFLMNIGAINSGRYPPIDYINYKKAFCLFSFNLNSDFEFPSENDYINIPKEGFLNIELKFRGNIQNALKLVVYAQFDNVIEIDESRNVTVDYS